MSQIKTPYSLNKLAGDFYPLPNTSSSFHKVEKQKRFIQVKESQNENEDQKHQDKKLKEASQLYEKHFLKELVKAMRKTAPQSSFTKPSMAEKIYKQKLDEEYVEKWGDREGIGLADMIYRHVKDRLKEEP